MIGHGYLTALQRAKSTVYGPNRTKIGTLGKIYLDVGTGDADFVSVHLGFFGTEESIVSLDGATIEHENLHVVFSKEKVRHAPNIDPVGGLSDQDKDLLDRYYGQESGPATPDVGM